MNAVSIRKPVSMVKRLDAVTAAEMAARAGRDAGSERYSFSRIYRNRIYPGGFGFPIVGK